MGKVTRNQLSPRKAQAISEPGTYTDGAGLTLRVHESGGKNWVLRLTYGGKRRQYGLGGFPAVSVKQARGKAAEMREAAYDGISPALYLQQKRGVSDVPTFKEATEKVIELRTPTWTSQRYATKWRESLENHAFPSIGRMQIDSIEVPNVLAVLTPIWTAKAEMAGRVRQRMATVFDYAIAAGWRKDNPCNGVLKAALPSRKRERRHHPALPYPEIAETVDSVRELDARPATKLALEFLILTAARPGEVRQATWDEIDLDAKVWNVPAEHMKMRKPHRVPLSTAAIEVLEKAGDLFGQRGLLFPSPRNKGKPLSDMAFLMLLRRNGHEDITPHGFRATFRTWTLEQTDTPWAVAEAALAHSLGGGEVVPYIRSDLFEKRRVLMDAWGDYVTS